MNSWWTLIVLWTLASLIMCWLEVWAIYSQRRMVWIAFIVSFIGIVVVFSSWACGIDNECESWL